MRFLLKFVGALIGLAVCLGVHYIAGFMGGNASSVMRLNPGLGGAFSAVLLLFAGGLGFILVRYVLFKKDYYYEKDRPLPLEFVSGLVGGYYLPLAFYTYVLVLIISIACGGAASPEFIVIIFK